MYRFKSISDVSEISKTRIRFIGKVLSTIFPILLLNSFLTVCSAQQSASIAGDFPDPTVIQADGQYYAVGTSSEWGPHFPIYRSHDLADWKQVGHVFESPPEWTASSFWAPEYYYLNGMYYLYYSAKRKSDGVSCIGVATSRYPDKGFVDQGIVVDYGSESIDAYVVREGDELYMTWKAYGLDERPIELVGAKLSADGFRLESEPFSLLMDTAHVGIEGQSFVFKDGYYYMFYSAGACCGVRCDYHVQAVRSKSLKGPYERVGGDQLLGENANWKCMGHGTFVHGQGDKLFYLFHGYNKVGTTYTGREGLLAELIWDGDIPRFVEVEEKKKSNMGKRHFDLTEANEGLFWQWDYRHASPQLETTDVGLRLSGKTMANNKTGIALTLRPTQKTYQFGTEIDIAKSSASAENGLVLYGDHDQSIGLSVRANELLFWQVKDGKRSVLRKINTVPVNDKLRIKLEIDNNLVCHAYVISGSTWEPLLPVEGSEVRLDGISPWDRSPRPGLFFGGSTDDYGVFTMFYIENAT